MAFILFLSLYAIITGVIEPKAANAETVAATGEFFLAPSDAREYRSASQRLSEYLKVGFARTLAIEQLSLGKDPSDLPKKATFLTASKSYSIEINVLNYVYSRPGGYLLELFIGTPPQRQLLLFDSFNLITWVQCQGCSTCYTQLSPTYSYTESSSFSAISCTDDETCSTPNLITACSNSDICLYGKSYSSSFISVGYMLYETFTFRKNSKANATISNVLFGCSLRTEGITQFADGISGFGRGSISLQSQLKSSFGRNAFSTCLVRNFKNSTSKLIMGSSSISPKNISYTPMLTNPYSNLTQAYLVEVTQVWVGYKKLSIPSSVWKFNSSSSVSGTIIYPSSIFTFINTPAYNAIVSELKKQIKNRGKLASAVDTSGFSPCFKFNLSDQVSLTKYFPTISFVFKGGAKVKQLGYHYIGSLGSNLVCSLFQPNDGYSVLGSFFQQNFLIVYDVQGKRVGFKAMDCANGKPR